MAVDLYRVTWIFSGKKHGWSETWIIPKDQTTPGGLAPLTNAASQARANMLGREYAIDAVRVAKIRLGNGNKVKRNVFLQEVGFVPSDKSDNNSGDAPDSAVIGNAFDATGGFRKQFFIGAPPDGVIANGGDLVSAFNGWGGRFTTWMQAMNALGVGWLQRQPVVRAGMDFVTVTNYVMAATGIVTITSDVGTWGAGPYTKQTVSIHGLNGANSNLNGQLQVLPKTDTTCVTVKPRPSLPFTSDGFMTTYVQPYPFVAQVLMVTVKGGNHKRGRPLLVSPGRARRVVRV